MIYIKKIFKYFFIIVLTVGSFSVYASITDGTIDATYKGALLCTNDLCTTTTRINLKPTLGNAVHITDTVVTGDIWSEDIGWIRMNPSGGFGGVTNNTSGTLGGYAWGDTAGWINFAPARGGVSIDTSGQFIGWAWSENYGWIKFDCSVVDACTKTDWRPLSVRPVVTPPGGSTGGGMIIPPAPPVVVPPVVPPVLPPVTPPVVPAPVVTPAPEPTTPPTPTVEPPTPPVTPGVPSPTETPAPAPSTAPSFAITQVVISSILNNAKDSFNNIVDVEKKASKEVKKILDTPQGDISSKIVTTGGAIAGAAVSVATVLFANPLSFGELFLIPFRLWSLLLAALGLKKRNKPWGTVYDSVTKQPLDPAYVILEDMNGNEVSSSITDLDGRYGFLVPAGQYRMSAKKTNYSFPSNKLAGRTSDELYQDLYFSGTINVEEGGVITKNIPMDPLKFDWNEFAKRDQKLMKFFSKRDLWIARISNVLFIFGFIVTLVAALISPAIYNIGILVVYLLLFILKRTILKPRAFGFINTKDTKNPLSFAIMRVFYAGSDSEVIHKVTDQTGKYFCLIPNGTYYTKVENKNPDESYTLVHTSEPIEVKDGYLSEKFEV